MEEKVENQEEVTEKVKKDLQDLSSKIQEDLKEVENSSDEEIISKFLDDPKTVSLAKESSGVLHSIFKEKSFDVEKMMKRTPWKTEETCLSVLQVLMLKGFVSGYEVEGKVKYKVTLTPEDRVEIYKLEIEALEEQITQIQARVRILKYKVEETEGKP